jgi:hypothetical protein
MIVRSCKHFAFGVIERKEGATMRHMNRREIIREKQRTQTAREELLERMSLALPNDGAVETLDGLFLARLTEPMEVEARTL